jgi:hypothetical protein
MWPGSGLITQLIYAAFGNAIVEEFAITTETGIDLLTEGGDTLQVEH